MRLLSDFTNADGKAPDGRDNGTDDSSALRKALEAGPGMVHVGPGYYRWTGIKIPADVSLIGSGPATIVRPAGGTGTIFQQVDVGNWVLRDMVLDGEADGDWHTRVDRGCHGVETQGCWGFEISGLLIRNFSGAGLQISSTKLFTDAAPFCNGGNLDRISATRNFVGLRLDKRGEYLNATNLSAYQNVTGAVIHAGNAKLAASNFCSNLDGILIEDKENGSHGSISNCLVNHNERYALLIRRVENGMNIDNCCLFYGKIAIDRSTGVNITSGEICCHIAISGAGANRIAGNYVIPCEIASEFTFTPETIVRDNFTRSGPWELNREPRQAGTPAGYL